MKNKSKTELQKYANNQKAQEIQKYFKKQRVQENGITLIALVVTIIILLILAGVSISTLSGQNGLIGRSRNAVDTHQRGSVIEKAQQDLIEQQLTNAEGGSYEITKAQLETILNKYFDGVADADVTNPDQELTANEDNGGENVKVKISDIYDGTLAADKEVVGTDDKTTLTEGYYVQKNGKWCIVFADLAVGKTGEWHIGGSTDWGHYSYPADTTTTFKTYYTIDGDEEGVAKHTDSFGTKKILYSEGNGADRFYAMALEDIDPENTTWYYWYYAAYGKLESSNNVAYNADDFGNGKANTKRMIDAWNEPKYGNQNAGSSYKDMWGVIQYDSVKSEWGDLYNGTNDGWFIASKDEWAAFADYIWTVDSYSAGKISTSNYVNYGLKSWYWSSAQSNTLRAYFASFNTGSIRYYGVDDTNEAVRFCSTF